MRKAGSILRPAGGVDHRRGDTRVSRIDADGHRDRRVIRPSHEEERREDVRRVARVRAQTRQVEHPEGTERHPGRDERTGADPREQLHVRRRRGDHDPGDHRQERESGGDRRHAEVLLQEVGQKQEHREDRDRGHRHGEVGAAAVAVEDDAQGQQRMLDPALDGDERSGWSTIAPRTCRASADRPSSSARRSRTHRRGRRVRRTPSAPGMSRAVRCAGALVMDQARRRAEDGIAAKIRLT